MNTPKVITKEVLTRVGERFSIHFRLADFGVKKSGLRVGKCRGMFDEGFRKINIENKSLLNQNLRSLPLCGWCPDFSQKMHSGGVFDYFLTTDFLRAGLQQKVITTKISRSESSLKTSPTLSSNTGKTE